MGGIIILISVLIALVADQQLRKFRLNPENNSKTMDKGLWKLSRHPNYFGEILSWWGLFIIALGFGLEFWWTGIGALTITLMFLFISIPMLEKRAVQGELTLKNTRKIFRFYSRNCFNSEVSDCSCYEPFVLIFPK